MTANATVFLRVMKTVRNELVMAAAQLRTSRDNLLTVYTRGKPVNCNSIKLFFLNRNESIYHK